jgi:hypothetical protein
VFHTSLLTPYTETPSHGPNFTHLPPDLIDGEEEYKVEQIRSHWTWGWRKTLQYLIKWKGYPKSDNTWENTDQVHAPMLIKLYHQATPQASLKGREIRLRRKHSPIISPPKTFSHPPPSPTILRDSTAALVWSKTHEDNNRSACSPPAPLVPYPSVHQAHTLSSATSMGNPSILQTSTANSDNSPSNPLRPTPDSSTPCPPSAHTTHQMNRQTRHPSNCHPAITCPLPCHSHLVQSAPHSRPKPILTTACCIPLPMVYYRPSPTERQVLAWPPRGTKTASTTWSNASSTTSKPSMNHPLVMSSTLGRSVISKSQSATDCIKRPNGYASTTTVPSRATTAPKGQTSSPISSTYMPPPTIASTLHSNHSQPGSNTCSLVWEGTFRFYRKRWLTWGTGALPVRSPDTDKSTTTSWQWLSRLKSTSGIWMLPRCGLDLVSLGLCSRGRRRESLPCKMCQGRLVHYNQVGRGPPAHHGAFMSARLR